MRRSVVAFLAICAFPASGGADQRLTPAEIVDFFTRDAAAAASPAENLSRSRGVAVGQPGADAVAPDTGRSRSVFVGPAGFGDGDAAESQAAQQPALDLLITFKLDSASLTDEARQNLDAFVEALHHPALAGLRFAVEGHTDATGSADYNMALSERRAAAVADYLAENGIDRQRMAAQGFGETRPRTADADDPLNRRVETRRLP